MLALVAACYRAPSDSCVIENSCPPDASPDMTPVPACTLPVGSGNEQMITAGTWLAAELGAEPYAIKSQLINMGSGPFQSILGTTDDVTAGPATFTVVEQGVVGTEFQSPRLSYGGRELYTRIDTTGAPIIARTTRDTGEVLWATLDKLTLLDAADQPFPVIVGTDPSPPTLTKPRRMILAYGTLGFDEFEEQDPQTRTWKLVRAHVPAYDVEFTGQAQLTADGLHLVFHSVSGSVSTLHAVDRPGLDAPFGAASHGIATLQANAFRPSVSPDCKLLFYDDGSQGFMVTY